MQPHTHIHINKFIYVYTNTYRHKEVPTLGGVRVMGVEIPDKSSALPLSGQDRPRQGRCGTSGLAVGRAPFVSCWAARRCGSHARRLIDRIKNVCPHIICSVALDGAMREVIAYWEANAYGVRVPALVAVLVGERPATRRICLVTSPMWHTQTISCSWPQVPVRPLACSGP